MRRKLNTGLVLAALGLFTVATACGDDSGTGSPGNGEAGESGSGSGGDGATSNGGSAASGNGSSVGGNGGSATSGNGGSATSGNGGSSSGNGGSLSGVGGEPAVNGGAGDGGEPAVNGGAGGDSWVDGGESGSGGVASGDGGESGSGGAAAGAGGGGPVICTPITLSAFEGGDIDAAFANYSAAFTPNIGAAASDRLVLSVQAPPAYDGDRTGTFDLTENGDDNYRTCARCVLVYADGAGEDVFYASGGTLVIDPASTQLAGTINATITNLTLVEVTIAAGDYTSTPVPNGRCLTVASAEIAVVAPPCDGPECIPAGWSCDDDYFSDGDCDCGCGVKDWDCTGTADDSECGHCVECRGDFNACSSGDVDPANTTMCL